MTVFTYACGVAALVLLFIGFIWDYDGRPVRAAFAFFLAALLWAPPSAALFLWSAFVGSIAFTMMVGIICLVHLTLINMATGNGSILPAPEH